MTATSIAVLLITFLVGPTQSFFGMDDCCMPEAMAKLVAAAGFVDIVGTKLGMPAQQAAG
jgi:hypothetical protein